MEGCLYEIFRHCYTKKFPENRDTQSFWKKNFQNQKFSETKKRSSTNFFVTVRQKKSTENRDNPPPPLSQITLFGTDSFRKHRKVFLQKVSELLDKNIFDEIVIPPFIGKNFQNQKFSKTKRGFCTKSFGTVRQYFRQNRDSLSYWEGFSEPEVFWYEEGFLYEMFWHCLTKIIDRNLW